MTARCLALVVCLLVIGAPVGGAWASQQSLPETQVEGGAATAQLEAGSPDVLYQPPDSPSFVVPTGDTQDVRPGDGIAVSAGGRATLQFRDSLRVQIFHDSEIHIESSLQPDPDAPLIYYFSMLAGTIFGEHDAATVAQRRVVISTPNGVTIQPTGTQFLVYYDTSTETCWVVTKEGQVRVSAGGIDLDVPAGFQTWVEKDQAPEPLLPSGRGAVDGRFPFIVDLTDQLLGDADFLPVAMPISPPGPPAMAEVKPAPLTPSGAGAPLPPSAGAPPATATASPAPKPVVKDQHPGGAPAPTVAPTAAPTVVPTAAPTVVPTAAPTVVPTAAPPPAFHPNPTSPPTTVRPVPNPARVANHHHRRDDDRGAKRKAGGHNGDKGGKDNNDGDSD